LNIDGSIGYIICTVARKVHQHLTDKFKTYDITPEQWVVLKKLSEQNNISQRELSYRVDKDPNNIKALVDKLENKSLVKRMVNANDKRAFLLCITEKGKKLIEELTPLDEKMIVDLGYGLNNDEINQLKLLLLKICANISKN
jgi:DNA-binding MarR family transcriptional regulator